MSDGECENNIDGQIAGFVAKTFQILNNDEYSRLIVWGPSGKDFIIKDTVRFQQIVLPRYFRHKKINSFIRQLNMYGFHKSRKETSKDIFSHPCFLKGREDLLPSIKRKIKSQPIPFATPKKEKQRISEKLEETAVKQKKEEDANHHHQVPCGVFRGFFDSHENINSACQFNFSLKKVSMCDFELCPEIEGEDEASIGEGIEEEERGQCKKIMNPSMFFGSNAGNL